MSASAENTLDKKAPIVIGILSVAIPLVVAFLLFLPQTGKLGDLDVSFLPHLNGVMNTATSLCLIAGYFAVKKKNTELHRVFMLSAFALSIVFLVSYVLYHFQVAPTPFGGTGTVKLIYFFLLISHILLSVAVVPLVLSALYFAFTKQIDKHKKVVKYTLPFWLYVSVTGVLVYLMISPYYVS